MQQKRIHKHTSYKNTEERGRGEGRRDGEQDITCLSAPKINTLSLSIHSLSLLVWRSKEKQLLSSIFRIFTNKRPFQL